MSIHPKTSGAAVGSALGVVIDGILHSIHGVHLAPELYGAIPTFLGLVLSWFVPAPALEAVAKAVVAAEPVVAAVDEGLAQAWPAAADPPAPAVPPAA